MFRKNPLFIGMYFAFAAAGFVVVGAWITSSILDATRPYIVQSSDSSPKIKKFPISILKSNSYKIEFSNPTKQGSYTNLRILVTPLKNQKDYDEIHCAFYNSKHQLIGTSWTNWSYNPTSSPISLSMDFLTTDEVIGSGLCWIKGT